MKELKQLKIKFSFLFWALLALIFIANALTSYISASEFWPLTLSKEILNFPNSEISFFFKPVFHALLSTIYLLPLSNEDHILAARTLFALVGAGSVYFFLKWLTQIQVLKTDRKMTSFALFLLVSSPLFFSQIVKIRSDNLSLFLTLFLLCLATASPPPWRAGRFITLVAVHFLLLGTTPRAAFHSLIAVSFLIPFYWNFFQSEKTRTQLLLTLVAPLISFAVILFPLVPLSGHHLLRYFLESFSQSGMSTEHGLQWLKNEFVLHVLVWLSLILIFFKRYPNRLVVFAPFAAAILTFSFADLKTPYLLASIFPFLLLPLLFFVSKSRAQSSIILFFIFLISIGFVLKTQKSDWWSTNREQLAVIRQITKVLDDNPKLRFFDGLGLLPRSNQIPAYLGPNDDLALNAATYRLTQLKPDVVLYTARFELLGPEMTSYLLEHYEPLASNLYIRKGVQVKAEKFEFATPPVLLFHLSPLFPAVTQ